MLTGVSGIDQNLILTGYLGPAQLVIARRTAERLKMPFVDFDMRLEQLAEMPADDVRTYFGEARLKTLEGQVIDEFALYRGTTLHVSGAILAQPDYFVRLRPIGFILAFTAALDAVLARLHLALGARFHDPRERDIAIGMLRREWAIRQRAGEIYELDTTALTENGIIEAVVTAWRDRAAVIDWRSAN